MTQMPAESRMSDNLSDQAVLDIAHLDQYTLGDHALQSELLQLFRIQLKDQTSELMNCEVASAWKSAAHMLKGASRAVGAWQINAVAEQLEAIEHDDEAARVALLSRLLAVTARFEGSVGDYL